MWYEELFDAVRKNSLTPTPAASQSALLTPPDVRTSAPVTQETTAAASTATSSAQPLSFTQPP
eukprot:1476107-Amphidinium_carterae.1